MKRLSETSSQQYQAFDPGAKHLSRREFLRLSAAAGTATVVMLSLSHTAAAAIPPLPHSFSLSPVADAAGFSLSSTPGETAASIHATKDEVHNIDIFDPAQRDTSGLPTARRVTLVPVQENVQALYLHSVADATGENLTIALAGTDNNSQPALSVRRGTDSPQRIPIPLSWDETIPPSRHFQFIPKRPDFSFLYKLSAFPAQNEAVLLGVTGQLTIDNGSPLPAVLMCADATHPGLDTNMYFSAPNGLTATDFARITQFGQDYLSYVFMTDATTDGGRQVNIRRARIPSNQPVSLIEKVDLSRRLPIPGLMGEVISADSAYSHAWYVYSDPTDRSKQGIRFITDQGLNGANRNTYDMHMPDGMSVTGATAYHGTDGKAGLVLALSDSTILPLFEDDTHILLPSQSRIHLQGPSGEPFSFQTIHLAHDPADRTCVFVQDMGHVSASSQQSIYLPLI